MLSRALLVSFLLSTLTIFPQEEGKKLTEVQNLKAENFLLKAQLTSCNSKLNEINLVNEQEKLIEEFRKQLGTSPEATWDWNTKTFKQKEKK